MSSNAWNDFQHEHAGEGLDQTEMSDMYHAEHVAADSSDGTFSTGEMNGADDGPSIDDSGLDQSVVDNSNTNDQNEESSGNAWNDFQHEHAGDGLSRDEMSEMYRGEQNNAELNDEATAENETNSLSENSSNVNDASTSAALTDSELNKPNAGNAWNDFEHEHAGEGLSSAQMAETYRAQQNTSESNDQTSATNVENSSSETPSNSKNEPAPTAAADLNINPATNHSTAGNSWNDFQHEHAGEGLEHAQMAELYYAQQYATKSNSKTPISSEVHKSSEHLSKGNEVSAAAKVIGSNKSTGENTWNDFEHKHVGEGKTASELAGMYRKENHAPNSTKQPLTTIDEQSRSQTLSNENLGKMLNDANSTCTKKLSVRDQDNTVSSSVNVPQHRSTQKPGSSIQWNLFQHLHRGKYPSKQEMSMAYNQFKENEKSFQWMPHYQLNLTPDGKLQEPNSPVGREAMKTGLFDEDNRLRRRKDIPYRIFESKMSDMNIKDRSQISSMYSNETGTPHLHAAHLRQHQYRNHAARNTTRRDADHILELQVVAPALQKQRLDDENFHMLRTLLNSKENIESRGIQMNRYIKAAANRGIARNDISLIKETFKQEERQAKHAQYLADLCREKNCSGAEAVFRKVAERCNALHDIHGQIMRLSQNENGTEAEQQQRQINLLDTIQRYESQYGSLKFRGNNLTKYRQDIIKNHLTYDPNNNYFHTIN